MSSKIILPEKKTESETEDLKSKNTTDKCYKIFYNKKWLILIVLIIIGIMFYIYYYDLPLYIPIPVIGNLFTFSNIKSKKNKKRSDNINELGELNDDSEDDSKDDNDDWNLEDEIQNYMNKQHEAISQIK